MKEITSYRFYSQIKLHISCVFINLCHQEGINVKVKGTKVKSVSENQNEVLPGFRVLIKTTDTPGRSSLRHFMKKNVPPHHAPVSE